MNLQDDYDDEGQRIQMPQYSTNRDAAQAAMSGGASGGASGALTNAGISGLFAAEGSSLAAASPYMLAGGLALGALSSNAKKNRAEAEARAVAENKRRANVKGALQQLSTIYSRMVV